MRWSDELDFAAVPEPDRRRARTLAGDFHDAAEAQDGWPLDDRWLLPLLGCDPGLEAHARQVVETLHRGLPVRLSVERVLTYAEATGVADVLDLHSQDLERICARSVRFYGVVGDALYHAWYRDAVVDALRRLAEFRAAFRLAEVAERPTWARPPRDPALHGLWSLTYSTYRTLRKKQRLPGSNDALQIDWDHLQIATRGGTLLELDPPAFRSVGPAGAVAILRYLHSEQAEQLATYLASPRWERQLQRLDPVLMAPEPEVDDDKPLLGWLVLGTASELSLLPVRCRQKKRGDGYVLRRISVPQVGAALWSEPTDEEVTRKAMYGSPLEVLLELLVGHPRVFVEQLGAAEKGAPVQVRRAEVALGMLDEGAAVAVTMLLDGRRPHPGSTLLQQKLVIEFHDGVLRFAPIRDAERRALLTLPSEGVVVPRTEVGRLLERLPTWSASVRLAADPGVLGPTVDPDLRPVVRLEMEGAGLTVQVRVQPLPEVASTLPGQGASVLAAMRDGAPVHIQRDLGAEIAAVSQAIAPLGLPPSSISPFRWHLDGMQDVLRVVEACRNAEERLRVRWAGRPPGLLDQRLDARDLALKVQRSTDWFGIAGTARAGGHELSLASLLEAVADGHAYVPISKNQWVGLADGLREHLALLAQVGGERDGLRLSGLHAPLLDGLLDQGMELDAPPDWFEMGERLHEAAALDPQLPRGLNATLRPYQREGFVWLARMAHWAPGAVLADDMGLGKTVQTLALLLHRADGPALVVAPASVLTNWRRELERFAPSLGVRLYWGPGRDLAGLQPGEVVLTTYGTLQRDAEQLAGVHFRTAVLDEAQAIKNPSAQRSRAAFTLDADFRLGLSGTPVENRTEELWSLFRFVAPGLLGSQGRFQTVFVNRIEGQEDRGARASLAALVGPFLLRRTKAAVATDLPDRVEMVHEVQLSSAERALYERTRLECVLRLEQSGAGGLAAVAELLKLRKLACNPRLYDPGSPVKSAKLHAVVRTARDLRASGHRMLVFSQFTSHLALVREALEAEGFTLCGLDGSMPLPRRQVEVDRFQTGEVDAFLISLKAGGTGLNLTAATYVLHLDPWWNPAAEDQATDRAHRIGQHQAVTVIRFVSMGTVEEQILAMHDEKRELAEALLAGRSAGSRMSPEVVLGLLRQPMDQIEAVDLPPAEPVVRAPPAASLPSPPAADDLEALLDRFSAWLSSDGRRPPTVRAYCNAARHFAAWLEGALDIAALRERGPAFIALAKAGEAGSKSDKVYASPALASLEVWLTQG